MPARLATKAEVLTLAPELTDDAVLDELIEVAGTMINVGCWGSKASKGHAALAAHLATTVQSNQQQQGQDPVGPIGSRSIGSISVGYTSKRLEDGISVVTPSDPELGTTTYGRLYLILRKSLFILPLAARA